MDSISTEQARQIFLKISLEKGVVENTLKAHDLTTTLLDCIKNAGIQQCDKKTGNMLYSIATRMSPSISKYRKILCEYLGNQGIYNSSQLTYIFDYLKNIETKGQSFLIEKFEKDCGIGRHLQKEQISGIIIKYLETKETELKQVRYKFNKVNYMTDIKKEIPYVDGKLFIQCFNELIEKTLGPQTQLDKAKKTNEKKKDKKQKAEEEPAKKIEDLVARDMNSLLNSKELLQKWEQQFGNKVYTRFPPQPNGYLHIGHAKSIRFNFSTAKSYKGHCYLRYDDTNPQKQTEQYITSIAQTVKWLGYEPYKVTYSSDRFDQLYQFAKQLIKIDKAFVCFENKETQKNKRKEGLPSAYRNEKIEDSLKRFQYMRMGMYEQGEACLRCKIDPKHPNTTLRDPVIYRIKYKEHPHSKDKWCIYPLYDFTHPILDSLQGITHSCCTLQFQIRRQLYYWFLQQLNLYRPYVWQFSRLNISHSILSKRKMQQLVDLKYVDGWDDPRLLTIMGMKRRGIRPQAINNFCDLVSVTRRSNQTIIQMSLLQHCISSDLDNSSPRNFAILNPILLKLPPKPKQIKVPNFPKQPQKGSHILHYHKNVFIQKDDIKDNEYGIAVGRTVGLKYLGLVNILEIGQQIVGQWVQDNLKVKTWLHWLPEESVTRAEFRIYKILFLHPKPMQVSNFLTTINPNSLQKKYGYFNSGLIQEAVEGFKVQFERVGYFCVDKDSSKEKFVWNLTLNLQNK